MSQVPTPPPLQTLSYHSSGGTNTSAVWRDGYLVVATKEARFPDRCVKCNAPATHYLKRKLTWHHPLIYLVILANLLIYAIVAMAVQKRGTIYVALCEHHLQRRKFMMLLGLAMFVGAIMATVGAIALENLFLGLMIPVLIVAALVFAVIAGRVVVPDHIDEKFVYLKNVNQAFMLSLPSHSPNATELDNIVVSQLQQSK